MAGISIVRQGEGEALNAMGVAIRFVCRGEETRKAWSLMECEIPRGYGPPPHEHPWDEAYFVTSGEVEFLVDGRVELTRAGDFVYARAGTPHGFRGASANAARMLIFDAPSHAEGFFKELDREVKEMPRDLPKALAIGSKHQIRFLAPS